jgi:hypothetical protein
MIRWLSVALFVVAVMTFFFVGRAERLRRQRAVETAEVQVRAQLQREYSGSATPANRIMLLRNTVETLGSIKYPSVPSMPEPTSPQPTVPVSAPPPALVPQITADMPLIVTAVFALFSIGLIIAKKQDDDTKKWACATLGTILGFWLNSK